MADPPRRRRSPSSPPPRRPGGSSLLPTIALGIGVVVAGLGIGAFLSALQAKHGSTTTTSTATSSVARVTPVPQATRGPVAIATLVAHPTPIPTLEPTPTPAPTASPERSPTPQPSATPAGTASPAPSARPSLRPSAAPSAAPSATPRASEAPTTKPSARPTERATVRPSATPAPKPVPTLRPATPAPRTTPVTVAGSAANTVRRYLADLIAGNETAAYAELGKAPGDSGAQLSEEAFIDRNARITSIRTTGTDATGTTIGVDITSAHGTYYATYHVTNGPNGPVIDQHDFIKV